jgi:predicted membrane protein
MFTAGFLLFLGIFTLAFWVLLFLSAFALPYALTIYMIEKFKGSKSEEETTA